MRTKAIYLAGLFFIPAALLGVPAAAALSANPPVAVAASGVPYACSGNGIPADVVRSAAQAGDVRVACGPVFSDTPSQGASTSSMR